MFLRSPREVCWVAGLALAYTECIKEKVNYQSSVPVLNLSLCIASRLREMGFQMEALVKYNEVLDYGGSKEIYVY